MPNFEPMSEGEFDQLSLEEKIRTLAGLLGPDEALRMIDRPDAPAGLAQRARRVLAQEEIELAIHDLFSLAVLGLKVFDPQSEPERPLAPQSHYQSLAAAIIAFTRTSGLDDQLMADCLAGALEANDIAAHQRRGTVQTEAALRDPVLGPELQPYLQQLLQERMPEAFRHVLEPLLP